MTPVISNVVSRIKYASSFPRGMPLLSQIPEFGTMLFEGKQTDLGKISDVFMDLDKCYLFSFCLFLLGIEELQSKSKPQTMIHW